MSADASASGDPRRYYGKYRGTRASTTSTRMQIGRVMVQVPDVLGVDPVELGDAVLPSAGIQAGAFIVPPIGAGVWVEFEQGDPDYPIWRRLLGLARRGAGAAPPRRRRSRPAEHRAADTRAEHAHDQRRAAGTRPAASCSRARPAR